MKQLVVTEYSCKKLQVICGAHVSFLSVRPLLEMLNWHGPLSRGQSIVILFRSESAAISEISLTLMRRNVLSDQHRIT